MRVLDVLHLLQAAFLAEHHSIMHATYGRLGGTEDQQDHHSKGRL